MRKIDISAPLGIEKLLVHGVYNIGKTYLLGSALAYEKQFGKCLYVHVAGEPSLSSILAHDLSGVDMITLEDTADITQLVKEYKEVPLHMIGVDSLFALSELATTHVTGDKHAPGGKRGVKDGRREWGEIKHEYRRVLRALFRRAEFVFAVAPTAPKENQTTGDKELQPLMTGRLPEETFGRFNFVGYLEAAALTPTKTVRTLHFEYMSGVMTRWNAPGRTTKPIKLSEGVNCWEDVRTALTSGLKIN